MITKLINTKWFGLRMPAEQCGWQTLAVLTVVFGIICLCSSQWRARQSSYSERNQCHDCKVSLIATCSKISPLCKCKVSASKLTHVSFPGAQKPEQNTPINPSLCASCLSSLLNSDFNKRSCKKINSGC